MPSEGAIILGSLAAFFFLMTFVSIGLKFYFKKKAEEDEAKDKVESTWTPAPAPAPSQGPEIVDAPTPSTTSTYATEPEWKFKPEGYESD